MSRYTAVLLLALGLAACAPAAPPPANTPEVTEAPFFAPDFALATLDGETVRLSDLRGGWVALNFWATWCNPCVQEMPALAQVAETYQDRLTLLAINVREPAVTVADFLALHDLALTVLITPDDATLAGYQVLGLPQTVVVAPDGDIVWRQFGPIDIEQFESDLSRLMG